ncbi:MAG: hydroxymethylglutaryl-CoA reductase, degradative [Myxococcota bacterium]
MPDFSGFYALPIAERQARLDVSFTGGLEFETADQMIENAIGTFSLPLGIACHFVIEGEPLWIPMAIEEPSVIAAASRMAKLASFRGGFKIAVDEPIMMGQIQLLNASDWDHVAQVLIEHQERLIELGNQHCPGLKTRGGGCRKIGLKNLNSRMAVVEISIDCRDAMGANLINTVLEALAPEIELLTGAQVGFKILSNLSDQRLARASCEIGYQALADDKTHDQGRKVAQRMIDGYEFAKLDPYRACTHNKGVMNGIGAVVIATGNDWRAVEAGAHAYAGTRPGGYGPLTHYEMREDYLFASIELPMALGVVGGVTNVHPTVKSCLQLLGNFGKSAKALAGVVAAVGLAQNMAAMRALAAEGIQKGHMALHNRKQL